MVAKEEGAQAQGPKLGEQYPLGRAAADAQFRVCRGRASGRHFDSYNRCPRRENPPMSTSEQKAAQLRQAALEYHEFPTPGKVAIAATKQLINQRDLALAYSPGAHVLCVD
eukprot:Opistho-2@4814